ncbi:hypothetical protein PAPYR_7022 [Paratrimastix pyriformis]|uniref:Uncharacterized protein n=1 Tax=Paratrimastix pyriformis TaxID=342808 RepID=A0ABQ8UE51_9EUKA|nr:hypothetical protein PAPYR_7022 [Paratrimastix pyriformis]
MSLSLNLDEVDCVCFDFDGTLINSDGLTLALAIRSIFFFLPEILWTTFREALVQIAGSDFGLTYDDYSRFIHSETKNLDQFFQNHSIPPGKAKAIVQARGDNYETLSRKMVALKPGMEQLLTALHDRGIPAYVATRNFRSETVALGALLPPVLNQTIKRWICWEDVPRTMHKPNPYPYELCIEDFITHHHRPGGPCRVVGFEDTPLGLKALLRLDPVKLSAKFECPVTVQPVLVSSVEYPESRGRTDFCATRTKGVRQQMERVRQRPKDPEVPNKVRAIGEPLTPDMIRLKTEASQLRIEVARLQGDLNVEKRKNEVLNLQLQAAQSQPPPQQGRSDPQQEGEITALRTTVERLQRDLSASQLEQKRLTSTHQQKEQEWITQRQGLDAQLHQEQTELDLLRSQLETACHERDQLQERLQAMSRVSQDTASEDAYKARHATHTHHARVSALERQVDENKRTQELCRSLSGSSPSPSSGNESPLGITTHSTHHPLVPFDTSPAAAPAEELARMQDLARSERATARERDFYKQTQRNTQLLEEQLVSLQQRLAVLQERESQAAQAQLELDRLRSDAPHWRAVQLLLKVPAAGDAVQAVTAIQQNLERLEGERDRAQEQLTRLEARNAELTAKVDGLQSSLSKAEGQLDQVQIDLTRQRSRNATLTRERQGMLEVLDSYTKEDPAGVDRAIQKRLLEAEQRLLAITGRPYHHHPQSASFNRPPRPLETAEQSLRDCQQDVARAAARESELKTTLAAAQQEVAELRGQRDALEREVAQLESRVAQGEYNPATTKTGMSPRGEYNPTATKVTSPTPADIIHGMSTSPVSPCSCVEKPRSYPRTRTGTRGVVVNLACFPMFFLPGTRVYVETQPSHGTQVLHLSINPQKTATELELVRPPCLPCRRLPVFQVGRWRGGDGSNDDVGLPSSRSLSLIRQERSRKENAALQELQRVFAENQRLGQELAEAGRKTQVQAQALTDADLRLSRLRSCPRGG